jgi:uncharacterized protein (TIGR02145 family)
MKTSILSQLLIICCVFLSCKNSDDYESTQIGNQIWMVDNLNVENFQNGDVIIEAKTKKDWDQAILNKQPAWCYFNTNIKNANSHGKFYNWFAVSDNRNLAPKGWRIPSINDWEVLCNNLGGKSVAGKKLKSRKGWDNEGNGTDEFGFNAIPVGWRDSKGEFCNENSLVMYWIHSNNDLQFVVLDYALDDLDINPCDQISYGFSIRCIKDNN